MPLESYAETHFPSEIYNRLKVWYRTFPSDGMRTLIQRNIDRECDRHDIDSVTWNTFLTQVADEAFPRDQVIPIAESLAKASGGPASDHMTEAELLFAGRALMDPVSVIDAVIKKGRSTFVLRGHEIPIHDWPRSFNYMSLEAFRKHYLPPAVIMPMSPGLGLAMDPSIQTLAYLIRDGVISGSDLQGKAFGKPGGPVWCTNGSLCGTQNATSIRDTLGLCHIDGGYLLEIGYNTAAIPQSIKAPTFLDASADGALNWIFVKNCETAGSPSHGYTAHLSGDQALRRGVPEAVHHPFVVCDALDLRLTPLIEPISRSAPGVDYETVLAKSAV